MIFAWCCFLGLPEARPDRAGPQDPPAHKGLLDLQDPRVPQGHPAHKGLPGLQDPLARPEQQGRKVFKV